MDALKDKMGRWRTKSLFIEHAHPDYPAIFTLDDEDKTIDGTRYISAKRKYLAYQDPAEHTFASSVFGSYACWQAVAASPDLHASVEEWRAELNALLRSQCYAKLKERAIVDGDVSALKQLQALLTPANKQPRTPGRPSKAPSEPARPTYTVHTGGGAHVDHSESLRRMAS